MKIVIDTNVLISALLWHGPSHELLIAVEKWLFTLCITPALLEELKDVLKRPNYGRSAYFTAKNLVWGVNLNSAAIFDISAP